MSKGIDSPADDLLEQQGSQVTEVAGGGVHAPNRSGYTQAEENATPPPVPGYYSCCDHCSPNPKMRYAAHTSPCHICKQCSCH